MTARESQRGSALLFVSMVGLVVSLGFTLLMNSTVTVESRAVEAELAKSRVYWAQMGDFNYALSRISYSAMCDRNCGSNVKDTDLATVLQAYFNELSDDKTWSYLDESANYSFTTAVTAAPDDNPSRQTFSGWLMASASYAPSALLASSAARLPLMELRLCVGLSANGRCGPISHNNGGRTTGNFSINRLTDLPSP